jgi:hypothetical protein
LSNPPRARPLSERVAREAALVKTAFVGSSEPAALDLVSIAYGIGLVFPAGQ